MRFRGGVFCLVCAAVALSALALAVTASAAGPGRNGLRFITSIPGSHGYVVEIATTGHKQVTLSVVNDESFASYTVRGRVTRNRIDADFGTLGRVSVRFSPLRPLTRASARPASRCHGRAPQIEVGALNGAIRFSGEEGFTDVATHHATGLRLRTFRRVCHGHRRAAASARSPQKVALTLIAALDGSSDRHVSFAALGLEANGAKPSEHESEPGLFVLANATERHEGVAIARTTLQIAEGGVQLSELGIQPVSATVAPPSPFSGSASLLQSPGSAPIWSGNLSVSLPGARNIPLTGATFQPLFCRTVSERVFDKCAKPFEEAQRPGRIETMLERAGGPAAAQLSGSQSQAFWDARLSWLR